jgi:hypothetical protein
MAEGLYLLKFLSAGDFWGKLLKKYWEIMYFEGRT